MDAPGPPAPQAAMTPARWAQLAPLLDALLDADPPGRAQQLAALRAEDAGLADELAALLAQDAALDTGFLAQPALPQLARSAADLADLADRAERATAAEQPGQTVGAYTLVRPLGQGGMGSVWLARRSDGRFEGEVAIKFLRSGLLGAGDAGRFAREGAILARLAHPHIARLLDAGVARDGSQPYLVLEHVDGLPIDAWCATRSLDLRARVRLLLDVLAAVAHAHNRLILHRDLKPSNILVGADRQAKLLDFGIAKLLDDDGAGGLAGELTQRAGQAFTPQYAAPEQVQGGEVTTATDVYALGVLLYGLLGGGHPTTEPTASPVQRLRTVVEVVPRRLSDAVREHAGPDATRRARALQGDLDTIVAKALKKAPAERYANAADLADDLRRWLRREPIAARPDGRLYQLTRFVQRHRAGVAAGALVLLSLGGGLGLAVWQGQEARRQRSQAESLIGFMLGELRERLEPVGRLDVLDAVGDQVLKHYAQMAAGSDDADLQTRRASALLLLGEVAEKRRALDSAASRYDEAAALTGLLLARRPDDGPTIAAHLDALSAVYDLHHMRGERAALPPLMARLRPLADRLHRIDPDQLDWRWQDAMLHKRQGVMHMDADALGPALEALGRAEQLLAACVAARPALLFDLAQVLGVKSRVLELQHDLPGALARMQVKQSVLVRVPGAADDLPLQVDLVAADSEIARLRLAMGELAQAEQGFEAALARSDVLLGRDPGNRMWQRQAITLRSSLAGILLAREDWPRAARLLAQAGATVTQALDQRAPERFFRVVLQGHVLAQRGQLALGAPTLLPRAGASAALADYLAQVRTVSADAHTLDLTEQRALGLAQLAQGDLLAAAGRAAEARGQWQALAALLADGPARRDVTRMLLLGEARLRLGDHAGAQALADAVAVLRPQALPLQQLRQRLAAVR